MTPDEFPCTPAESLDFLAAAAVLWLGIWLLAIYGGDWAVFLNNLINNI